jgi:hypothetical protein
MLAVHGVTVLKDPSDIDIGVRGNFVCNHSAVSSVTVQIPLIVEIRYPRLVLHNSAQSGVLLRLFQHLQHLWMCCVQSSVQHGELHSRLSSGASVYE